MLSGPIRTPWGMSDHKREVLPGIEWTSTPSHGGYHVSQDRQRTLLSLFGAVGTSVDRRPAGPWYEEDCDWCLVVLAFAEEFTEEQEVSAAVETAQGTLRMAEGNHRMTEEGPLTKDAQPYWLAATLRWRPIVAWLSSSDAGRACVKRHEAFKASVMATET